MRMRFIATSLVIGWAIAAPAEADKRPVGQTRSGAITARYRSTAERIVRATLADNGAYLKLEQLCIGIGHRLSGSRQLEEAIDWAIATLKKDGAENVRRERVMVPHWVRGRESATLVEPRVVPLHMLGLGGSVGTPPGGITAPVIVVGDEDELKALGDKVRGKIVLFNKAMPPYDPERGSGYGTAVKYRVHGARLAAEQGAVACLVRSATAKSLQTPHTGSMRYGDAKVKIPAAAITIEDTELIIGLHRLGLEPVVKLEMEAKTLPDAVSANVVAELRGSTHPDEIVVISGHFDSWDVGQGAHDDGGGCVAAMEAIGVLRKLGLTPRRTIRVVLWTNEENGVEGGKTYAREHAAELANHVVAIELDSGVFAPRGYSLECADKQRESVAVRQMREILDTLTSLIGDLTIETGGSGTDVSPMKDGGVVLMGHRVAGSKYFDYHHTHADTIDKVDPDELSQNVAVLATVAFILADMPARLGTTERRR